MINLSSLNDILNAEQQQQVQESTLAQKVAESAAQPKQYNLSPEAQSIVDEVQADRERELIRRRLMAYQDAMMQDTVNRFAGGSGIHIDPSKRGTFTAAASRHGMGVQEFASHVHAHPENYSPAMRRKANFARNAARWSHAYGGDINSYAYGDYIDPNTSIYDALRMAGIPFRTSNPSGYRGPGHYVGKARGKSAHAKRREDGTAYALDITGDFDKIRRMINASKPLQNYFAANGFGVHEELTKEALRKTGGTGPHFHIGLLSGKDVHDSGKNSSRSYAQADPSTGGYLSTYQPGMQVLATFDPSSAQDSFTPWWQRVAQTDENFLAQQAAGAAGGAYDVAQFVPSWAEPEQSSGTFPNLFAEGGPYNDAFMDYHGYSWVPGNKILLNDPYFSQIQQHNPDGMYAVDSKGYYVPASVMRQEWEAYNSAPSMNTPATAIPLQEVSYTLQDKDKAAIDAAQKMFGDNRQIIYEDLWNRGSSSATDILNKLDTLSQNSSYMELNTDPEYIAKLKQKKYKLQSDGRLRAQYNYDTNVATIEPIAGKFFEPYVSEFVHNYQYNNSVPGLNLIGYNPRAITKDRTFVENSYRDPQSTEYKAHVVLQPVMNQYLNTPSMNYSDFLNAIRSKQAATLALTKR